MKPAVFVCPNINNNPLSKDERTLKKEQFSTTGMALVCGEGRAFIMSHLFINVKNKRMNERREPKVCVLSEPSGRESWIVGFGKF